MPSFFDMRALPVGELGTDAEVARRIVDMPFGEAVARLGPMHVETRHTFAFAHGSGRTLTQSDHATLHADGEGAVQVVLVTPASRVEMLAMGDRVFIRLGAGQARQKARGDLDVDGWPDRAFAGLSQLLALFAPVTFEPHDAALKTRSGASAFVLRLGKPVRHAHDGATRDGDDATRTPPIARVQARLSYGPMGRWREAITPIALAGELLVDDATGVVVEARLDGRLQVDEPTGRPTQLNVHFTHTISEVGHAATLRPPPHAVAEFRRPKRPKDPLSFFRDHLGGAQAAGDAMPSAAPAPSGDD